MTSWPVAIWTLFLLFKIAQGALHNAYRLPNAVVPYNYKIGLVPDIYNKEPENFALYGKTEIFAKVVNVTKIIKVHSLNLTISGHVRVLRNNVNMYQARYYEEKYQWFVIHLKEELRRGDEIVIQFLRYHRPINHSLFGLYYYSRDVPGSKKKQYGVTTQLQTTYAREVFPCFDEPQMKATFDITVYRKPPSFALSNAPLNKSERVAGLDWYKDTFERTPKMSTYIVAVIITQDKGFSQSIRGVNFTIYYPPTKQPENVDLAMNLSREVFPALEDYFGVKYPLTKLDQIGFTSTDYPLGGMENLGLITYKDKFLYTFPNMEKYHRYIGKMVIHELTHQWFGNLVTMVWWDDLWLNEGMTEYFSLLRGKWLTRYKPRQLGMRFIFRAMSSETVKVLFPIYVPWAKTPTEIFAMMNDVTYMKGGMIILMAERIMGERIFKMAMRRYVQDNKYKSVTHKDLWNAFTVANKKNGKDVNMSRILNPWIMQPGYPLVTVKINYERNTIDYSQQLYYHTIKEANSVMPEPSKYNYVWPIPIQWKTGGGGISRPVVIFDKKGSVEVGGVLNPKDWLVVNPEANFYYIVNYERKYWQKLGRHLKANFRAFDELTRGKLIYDVMSLYRATVKGKGNYIDANLVNQVLAFAEYEDGDFPLAFLKEIWRRKDKNLMPIYKILESRKIFAKKPK